MFKNFFCNIKKSKKFADIADKYVNNNTKLIKISTTIGSILGFVHYSSYIVYKNKINDEITFVKTNRYIKDDDTQAIQIEIMGFKFIETTKINKSDDELNKYINEKEKELSEINSIFDIEPLPHMVNLGISTFIGGGLGSLISMYPIISVPSLVVILLINSFMKNKNNKN